VRREVEILCCEWGKESDWVCERARRLMRRVERLRRGDVVGKGW